MGRVILTNNLNSHPSLGYSGHTAFKNKARMPFSPQKEDYYVTVLSLALSSELVLSRPTKRTNSITFKAFQVLGQSDYNMQQRRVRR